MNNSVLNKSVWSHFKKADGRFDGLLFEKLSSHLLSRVYKGTWQQTKRSHDRGHDFEFLGDCPPSKVWAECKIHDRKLPLTVIGNTLVMALVDCINKLILISHSDLSHDCSLQIAHFARRTGCEVDVITGAGLDNIIIQYPEIIERTLDCFDKSTLPEKCITLPPDVKIVPDFQPDLVVLSEQNQRREFESKEAGSLPVLHPGNDFVVNVHVQNLMNNQSVTTKVRVRTSRAFVCYRHEADENGYIEQVVVSGPNQFSTIPLRFRVGDYPGESTLPQIEVFDQQGKLVESSKVQEVEISAVHWISNLIGKAANDLEKLVETCREPDKINCLIVDGHSGVGKTRFLAEVGSRLWDEGYDLLRIDMEELSGNDDENGLLLRHILAQIHSLPLLEAPDFEGTTLRLETLHDNDAKWVEQLLYDGVRLKEKADFDRCASILAKGLSSKHTAFLIDNAQNVSSTEQQVFERLGSLVQGKGSAVLLFSFNVDKIYSGSPGSSLYEYCQLQCTVNTNQWGKFTLNDFRPEDVRTFLNSALRPRDIRKTQFTDGFPLTTAEIEKHCAPRPLYLWHMLLELQTSGILKREGSAFVPRKANEFVESIRRLPEFTRNLLEYRWSSTLAEAKAPESLETIRTLIGLFFNVPFWVLDGLSIPLEHIKKLEDAGFVRRGNNDDLLPSHQEIFSLFEEQRVSKINAGKIAQVLELRGQQNRYLYQYFSCRDILNDVGDELLRQCLLHLKHRRVKSGKAQGSHFLYRLIVILDGGIAAVNDKERLQLLHGAIENLAQITSNSRLSDPLHICFEHARNSISDYSDSGQEFILFVHLISNICFARNKYNDPYALMKEIVTGPYRFSFPSEIERELCFGSLLNRLGVAAMWGANPEEALMFGMDCRNIAQNLIKQEGLTAEHRERAVGLCIETAIDLGNIGDIIPGSCDIKEILAYWQEAADLYDTLPILSEKRDMLAPMVSFYKARVLMAESNWDQSRNLLKKAIGLARKNRNAYHGIRCTILLVILSMLEQTEDKSHSLSSGINRLLDSALDWAVASGISHAEWGGLLIRAQIAFIGGNHHIAGEIALDSLKAFCATLPDEAIIELRAPYLAGIMAILQIVEMDYGIVTTDRHGAGYRQIFSTLTAGIFDPPWVEFDFCETTSSILEHLQSIVKDVPYVQGGHPLLSQ